MNYFVAEDVVHVRVDEQAGFVSACGYVYASFAVEWADEFEPEAWPACEDCLGVGSRPAPADDDVLVVTGVYALDDDAHLLVGREGAAWASVCGRRDPNEAVEWAGHDWPEAFDRCRACTALVNGDDLDGLLDVDDVSSATIAGSSEGSEPSLQERVRQYKLWVFSDDGIEHRPADVSLTRAMCGASLSPANMTRTGPMGGPFHCHDCDRAVGRARGESVPGLGDAVAASAGELGKAMAGARASRGRRARKRVAARPARRVGKKAVNQKKGHQASSRTDKEVLLYGRRMIVPIRFVRGGAPGLGRRR